MRRSNLGHARLRLGPSLRHAPFLTSQVRLTRAIATHSCSPGTIDTIDALSNRVPFKSHRLQLNLLSVFSYVSYVDFQITSFLTAVAGSNLSCLYIE